MRKWLTNVYFSFPVQLAILHLKSHLILLAIWGFIVLFINGSIGGKLGFSNLFLDPEYMGKVGFLSFFIIGATYGLFFMSWNLATYLLTAHHFPFLASLQSPFSKFCINNFIFPAAFVLFYIAHVTYFQVTYGQLGTSDIILYNLGYIMGILSILVLYSLYFHFTNRDISYYKKRNQRAPHNMQGFTPGRRKIDLNYIKKTEKSTKVRIYLNEFMRPRIVRSVAHYESSLLKGIFKQNHFNALIFQLLTLFVLVMLGLLIDFPASRIPAAASVFIMLSIFIAFIGAITYWFGEWNITVYIIILFFINFLTSFDVFHRDNHVNGLNYNIAPAVYSVEALQEICQTENINQDIIATEKILENWKLRNDTGNGNKPKMTILCVSGGGLKAAIWTMRNMQLADSLTQGNFLKSNVLMTGASGGMLGAAYLRELYLRQLQGQPINIYDNQYLDNISKDLLNSIMFTFVTNDFFLPFAKYKSGNQTFYKDRGYIFEKQFNENTGYVLDKKLADYKKPEEEGLIPMIYITPSIINDARRLIISPQGVTFMMLAPVGIEFHGVVEMDAVDYGWLFNNHNAGNLNFTSALRMNATYPYVLPSAHLPTVPEIEVMDAGFRDNFGILSATRFLQVYKNWILKNTSGVVLVQITSKEKIEPILPDDNRGAIGRLMKPLGVTGLMFTVQKFEQDNNIGFMMDLLGPENFEVIRFIYEPLGEDTPEAPVSFHITGLDKQNVLDALRSKDNEAAMRRLREVLGE
jgi:hypothetical protein